MLIQSIRFNTEFRTFPAGHVISVPNRVTVLVGDNGAGKSSLLGLLRGQFRSHWTPSQLSGYDWKEAISLTPSVPKGEMLTYIDLAVDHMGTRTEFDTEDTDVQISVMGKSSGQASLLQLSSMMRKTKARVHLIDEPERGLSPAKQWVLAALLREITIERPDDQFLVSTHSPAVMRALSGNVLFLPSGRMMACDDYLEMSDAHGKAQADRYIAARHAERTAV
jgi:predicted ATPase